LSATSGTPPAAIEDRKAFGRRARRGAISGRESSLSKDLRRLSGRFARADRFREGKER